MVKRLKTQRSTNELTTDLRHAIELLIFEEPETRSADLAERAVDQLDPATLNELGHRLVVKLALHLARMERSKARPRQALLPGFEHIPRRIAVSDDKRVTLENANFRDVRAYVRRLSNLHRDRARQDPKLAEGRLLLEKLAKYNRKQPGITVKQVMALEG